MLEYIITSKAKRSLLKLLLTNPDRTFYLREIARLTTEPVNAVRRELGYLEKACLVIMHSRGKEKYYSANKDSPIYSELKKIIYTTIGLGDYIREKIKDTNAIQLAFVYGSVASGSETTKSDIDLFVVGDIEEDSLHRTISEIEKDLHRTINYSLMDLTEFQERQKKGEPFIKRILAGPKIILRGILNDNPNVT